MRAPIIAAVLVALVAVGAGVLVMSDESQADAAVTVGGVTYTVVGSATEASAAAESTDISGDIVIMANVRIDGREYPVAAIQAGAFQGCASLASVAIPASVTSIGKNAFRWCTSLASVEIPASVTSIGNNAFQGCTSLASVAIPASVTSIGSETFRGCTSLSSVAIPASVTSIGREAFQGCASLASVIVMGLPPTMDSNWLSLGSSSQPVTATVYGLTSDEFVLLDTAANRGSYTVLIRAPDYTISFNVKGGSPAYGPLTASAVALPAAPERATEQADGATREFEFAYWLVGDAQHQPGDVVVLDGDESATVYWVVTTTTVVSDLGAAGTILMVVPLLLLLGLVVAAVAMWRRRRRRKRLNPRGHPPGSFPRTWGYG